ncbi:MAG: SAM-dependent methyltransferase [Magnetococcales bacterium]|nr:SAM-dependent methyltransferase [Magnetococcales bacterium]
MTSCFITDVLAPVIHRHGGAIPFSLFMDRALYGEGGYYSCPGIKVGRQGDFVTAPAISSLFAELLLLEWVHLWQEMGRPPLFTVLEIGGGDGQFAHDLWLSSEKFPDFHQALDWIMLERGDCSRQRAVLHDRVAAGRCRWIDSLQQLAQQSIEGVIFSNELFDALPVHWLEMTADGLRERGVALDASGAIQSILMPLQPPLTKDYFSDADITLWPGRRTEVGLAGQQLMTDMGALLRRGICITFDYGYPAHEYYSDAFPAGTLTGFFRHQKIEDPLQYPGQMDLTAHVDFTALARAGERAGLETVGFTTQGWYLIGLGILERLEQACQAFGQDDEGHRQRQQLTEAVKRLVMPGAMGERFKVLVQGRGIAAETLAGFRMNNQKKRLRLSCN